jgi:hypothetical protein
MDNSFFCTRIEKELSRKVANKPLNILFVPPARISTSPLALLDLRAGDGRPEAIPETFGDCGT